MSKNSFPESYGKITSSVLDRDTAEDQVQGSMYETGRNEPIPVQKDDAPVEDPVDAENTVNDKQTGNLNFPALIRGFSTRQH